jgi:hypothetical protein
LPKNLSEIRCVTFLKGEILLTVGNPLNVGPFVALFADDIPTDFATDFVTDTADIARYDLMFQ